MKTTLLFACFNTAMTVYCLYALLFNSVGMGSSAWNLFMSVLGAYFAFTQWSAYIMARKNMSNE